MLIGFYYDYFSTLSILDIAQSFLYGMRFDLSITALFYAPFLLTLLVSLFVTGKPTFYRLILVMAYFPLASLWLLSLVSIAYFGEVNRHLGAEILLLTGDWGFVSDLLKSSRVWWFLGGAFFVLSLAFIWHRYVVMPAGLTDLSGGKLKKLFVFFLSSLLAFLFIRGFEVQSRPLSVADAYVFGNEMQAALVMNGSFSIFHNSRRYLKDSAKPIGYFSEQEVDQYKANSEFNFYRSIPNLYAENQAKRNVVVILLESWSYEYIDGLSGSNFGATPFVDSLIKKSSVWTNAFAAGQRSIEGIQAVLTSVPLIEGRQTIGFGLEQNRITNVAQEANRHGYRTLFMQTSKARSFHVDAIAGLLGFSEYYSMEDYPLILDYKNSESSFGWDYDGLMYLADRLNQEGSSEKPYFSFFFTETTHEPFPDPGKQFHIYPHDDNWQNRYLNTLKYSDWAIQQFMERLSLREDYNETTFIFLADHVLRASMGDRHKTFHIPLIIYTPDGSVPAQVHQEFVSQYDILPTLDAMLGLNNKISTFGHSLLTESGSVERGILSKQGSVGIVLSQDGWSSFDAITGTTLETSSDDDALKEKLNLNKLRLQLVDESLRSNTWLPLSSK